MIKPVGSLVGSLARGRGSEDAERRKRSLLSDSRGRPPISNTSSELQSSISRVRSCSVQLIKLPGELKTVDEANSTRYM